MGVSENTQHQDGNAHKLGMLRKMWSVGAVRPCQRNHGAGARVANQAVIESVVMHDFRS
jgi:hypothetical protein